MWIIINDKEIFISGSKGTLLELKTSQVPGKYKPAEKNMAHKFAQLRQIALEEWADECAKLIKKRFIEQYK